MKDACGCFGYTGHQSTTHVDWSGIERCDLCGMPCMHQIAGKRSNRATMALVGLTAAAVLSGVAMVLTASMARRGDPDRTEPR